MSEISTSYRSFLAKGDQDQSGRISIIEGIPNVTSSNPPPNVELATLGMKTLCSTCSQTGQIVANPAGVASNVTAPNGQAWALDGDFTHCGCSPAPVALRAKRSPRVVGKTLGGKPCGPLHATPSGDFKLSEGNLQSINFKFTVHDATDEGQRDLFWAQQFWFEGTPETAVEGAPEKTGYLGLQRIGDTKKIIFSIWNALSATSMMPGAVAEAFDGEGIGQHVTAPVDWQFGTTYLFQLMGAGNGAWQVAMKNLSTNQISRLGEIQVPEGWGNLGDYVNTFTEVVGKLEDWDKIPYSKATFWAPTSTNGAITNKVSPITYQNYSNPSPLPPGACPGVNVGSRSEVVGNDLVLETGLNNKPTNHPNGPPVAPELFPSARPRPSSDLPESPAAPELFPSTRPRPSSDLPESPAAPALFTSARPRPSSDLPGSPAAPIQPAEPD